MRVNCRFINFKKSKQESVKRGWGHAYVDMEPTPLSLRLRARLLRVRISRAATESTGHHCGQGVELHVQVKNTGDRSGKETVQLYIEDVVSSVATPVKQLRGFAKLAIDPGATKTCTLGRLRTTWHCTTRISGAWSSQASSV